MMIILAGASSVGKSTLAGDWCKAHTEYHHICEVARDIMKEQCITRTDLKEFLASENKVKFVDFQNQIFTEQNIRETLLVERNVPFIADRGPDPLVFIDQNLNYNSALELAETLAAKQCLERYRSKNCVVVIVCPLDDIEDDNVRMVPTSEEQIQYTECLKKLLQHLNVPYKYCNITDRHERLHWLEETILSTRFNTDV
jgi:nicotinamide riboside kinase